MGLRINTIIFDFDGVIVDSGTDIANAVNHTLRHFGRQRLPSREIISYVGRGAENLIRRSFKEYDENLIRNALSYYKEYYLAHSIEETRLYPGVEATLGLFKEKSMAVVTNKPENLTRKILEGLGVIQYFKLVLGPESVPKMKPDPDGLLKVLSDFGEKPEKALMIGDSYTDIEAGRNAGTHTCGVTYGLGSTDELLRAGSDFVIGSISKLSEYIE